MESKFGLVNVWLQGDWVTRSVALLLLGMSLASWIVIVVKAIDLFRYRRLAGGAEPFWHSATSPKAWPSSGRPPTTRFASWPSKAAKPPPMCATARARRAPSCTTRWT
jgi:biopolymer transport protein ExbB